MEDLPMWLQYYPKVLFNIINRSGTYDTLDTRSIFFIYKQLGPPLDFINQKGSPSRFQQPKRDPINQKGGPPLGTISMDLAASNENGHLQKIWINLVLETLTKVFNPQNRSIIYCSQNLTILTLKFL